MTEVTRKLAHIERIEEIIPIEGADRIVLYRVLNWKMISKKDEFKVGDLALFVEPDAWVPNSLAPFLTKPDKFPKEYGGIQGERLKTVKMKGVYSQGLLLPVTVLPFGYDPIDRKEGEDFTELLGIIKWEPAPERIPVNAKGSFPSHTPKTDQERCISAGTFIDTTLGPKLIEDIVENQLFLHVLSYDHNEGKTRYSQIVDHAVLSAITEKWVKFTMEDGTVITVTDNHKVWNDDLQAYREARHFNVGDFLIQKTE